MFKRVILVLTLLSAQSAFAQGIPSSTSTLDTDVSTSVSPVVAVTSATGSVEQDDVFASSSEVLLPPAEGASTTDEFASTSLIATELGALSTSSTSTASTQLETEESTSTATTTALSEDKLFSLVFAGFEEFVERYLGWE